MTYPKYSKPVVIEVFGDTNTTSADMVAPPTVAGGECSQPTGFVQSNSAPARQFINWLFNYIFNAIRYQNQRGIADWDANENYYQFDRTLGSDGNTYVCQSTGPVSSNPTTTGQTDWVLWGLTIAQLQSLGQQFSSGDVKWSAAYAVPTGWLNCNGQAVSRTTYAALYAAIGTTYGGGDGSTTFNLPDLRGQFIRGYDAGRGVDPSRTFGSTQAYAVQSHTHGVTDGGHTHGASDAGHYHIINFAGAVTQVQIASNTNVALAAIGDTSTSYANISVNAATTGISIQATGSNETRPTNVAMLPIIKY